MHIRPGPQANALGDTLRANRKKHDLSIKEVSEATGIKYHYLYDIETGRRVPAESVILLLADHYKIEKTSLTALSGRLSENAGRWLKNTPEAILLVEKMAKENWSEQRIKQFLRVN